MLKNGLYNLAGAALRIGLLVVTVPLLIRLIGIEEYGLWAMVSAAVGVVAMAEAGLAISTTVFASQDLARADSRGLAQTLTATMGAMLALATFAAVTLAVGAGFFAGLLPSVSPLQREALVQAMRVGAVAIWAQLVQRVFVGLEQAYQRYGLMNTITAVQDVYRSLGLLAVAGWGGGIVEFMVWQAVVNIGALLVHAAAAWRLSARTSLRPAWNSERARAIARYSILASIASLGATLFTQVDRLIVGALLGPRMLGMYAAITSVTAQIGGFSSLAVQPFLPVLSSFWDKHNPDVRALVKRLRQAYQVDAFFALGMGGLLLALTPLVIRLILPDAAGGDAQSALQVAVIIYALYALNAVGYYLLLGMRSVWHCSVVVIGGGVFSLLLIGAGASSFGLLGALLGNAGFTITLILNPIGLKTAGLSPNSWLRWLWFPLAWFAVCIGANVVIPWSVEVRSLLFIPLGMALLAWFAMTHTNIFSNVVRRGVAE